MRKDTEHNNDTEKNALSEKEVWFRIRYLDPDAKSENKGAVVVALLTIVSIVCAVLIVLYLRGL